MRVTIFPDVRATSADAFDVTWEDFAARCQNPPVYPSKAECPLVKLGTLGDTRTPKGSLRHEQNILFISGIEADYDAGVVSPEQAADLLTIYGIRALIYTSPSHTPSAPRWRVLAPLSSDAPLAYRREMVGRLNAALGGILANESFTNAQSFYIGRVADAPYECHIVSGEPIDTLAYIEPVYPALSAQIAPADTEYEHREATPETIAELESALKAVPADDYETWTSVGIALAQLGEEGYRLWSTWSATSPKHDPVNDLAKWNTFIPQRTGFASIFSRAQRLGWVNPRASGAPVDTAAVFSAVQQLAPPPGSSAPPPEVIQGLRIASAEDQARLFNGCVYILDLHKMLVPGGKLIDRGRFDAWYGGYSFVMNPANTGGLEKSPWNAFLNSQILNWPRASGWCFRPERPPAEVIEEAGRKLVNIWWPVNTARVPGDVTPFTNHLHRLLPDQHDYEILLAYLAACVQYPGVKFQWCPVVQGTKGNGKSFLGSCLEAALGDDYCHRPNSADITNKFTGWLQRKLIVIIEEISAHDKRDTLDTLKPLITNTRIEIQSKGADQSTGDNRANFIMFVNPKGAIPIDIDERRYAVFHTAQQSAEDIVRDKMDGAYFPDLWNWARNGGFANIAYFLSTYQIPNDLNPATTLHRAPRTSAFEDAVTSSMGNAEAEILEAILSHREGFCGGWIGSHKLDEFIKERNLERFVTRNKRREMMRAMGYVWHPALSNGRTSNPLKGVFPPVRPILYLKADHPALALERPNDVLEAYLAAQRNELTEVFGASR